MSIERIGIIGAGAWGTALACVARRAGKQVVIWAHEAEVADGINRSHENRLFLPGVVLDDAVRATGALDQAADTDALLLAVPAQYTRTVTAEMAAAVGPATPLVMCAKGIEQETGALMTEVLRDTLPGRPMAVLSGPTFAAEVARNLPTAVTLACTDAALGRTLVAALGGQRFRTYLSDDAIGAEIGGAVKNVLAIACGIIEGRAFGDNARAALITRGLVEMTRLCIAKGGRAETMMGLSGLGDLTLTCNSAQSRNFSLGVALGTGEALDDLLRTRRTIAEGVFSAAAVAGLARRLGIEMPIVAAVDAVLNRGEDLDAAIDGLLSRPFRAEASSAEA